MRTSVQKQMELVTDTCVVSTINSSQACVGFGYELQSGWTEADYMVCSTVQLFQDNVLYMCVVNSIQICSANSVLW